MPDIVEAFAGDWDVLAELYRSRREALGMSIADVAARAETGRRFIWDLEHARPRPEVIGIVQVANALRIRLLGFPARPVGPWCDGLEPYLSDALPDGVDG